MSATRAAGGDPRIDEIARDNPKVEGEKVREAQELIEELRRGGAIKPSYGISSPYERKPLRKAESARRLTTM